MSDAEAVKKMAKRLFMEFRPSTEHGDEVRLHDFEADTFADIIAEYVDAALSKAQSNGAEP